MRHQWLDLLPPSLHEDYPFRDLFAYAIAGGHYDYVKHLYHGNTGKWNDANSFDLYREGDCFGQNNILLRLLAAMSGNLKLFDFFNEFIASVDKTRAHWGWKRWHEEYDAIRAAAHYGHLDLIKHFYNANPDAMKSVFGLAVHAGYSGNLEVLEYCYKQGFEWGYYVTRPRYGTETQSMEVSTAAAVAGHLHLIEYLHKHNIGPFNEAAIDEATRHNKIHVVNFLLENRTEGFSEAPLIAARKGYLEILKLLVKHDRKRCESTLTLAKTLHRNFKTEVIAYLHELQMDSAFAIDDIAIAAGYGRLDIVQFLHNHRTEGCTHRAVDFAAKRGHMEVLTWLLENRTEGASAKAIISASKKGRLDIVKVLHSWGFSSSKRAMDKAAKYGHLEVVKFLHEHRTEGCTTRALDQAIRSMHWPVVVYLLQNRDEGFTNIGARIVRFFGRKEIYYQLLREFQQKFHPEIPEYDADDDDDDQWEDVDSDFNDDDTESHLSCYSCNYGYNPKHMPVTHVVKFRYDKIIQVPKLFQHPNFPQPSGPPTLESILSDPALSFSGYHDMDMVERLHTRVEGIADSTSEDEGSVNGKESDAGYENEREL
jgi:hypothetical protein